MALPVSIVRAGAERVALPGLTQNISSSGVLFTAGAEPDLGGPIEYVITLNHEGPLAICLRCIGKVVRAECTQPNSEPGRRSFQIAATLERYRAMVAKHAPDRPARYLAAAERLKAQTPE